MNDHMRQMALHRLAEAPWRCKNTDKAGWLLEQAETESDIRLALKSPDQHPIALEALCALQSNSHHSYRAVSQLIEENPRACWCLVDSLNRLPWYSGIRAFLNHPDPPHASDCTLPFYILTRNRVFFPSDMCGSLYEYYVNGLWLLLKTAHNRGWRRLHPAGLAVLQLIHAHLERSRPDRFVVYLAALVLGDMAPQSLSRRNLRLRKQQHCHSLITQSAALALAQLPGTRNRNLSEAAVIRA
jgi:hypothetical protein